MPPRDMSRTYRHMSLFDCHQLMSQKTQRARALERSDSYLAKQELRRVRFNIKQLQAEIACKEAQLPLFVKFE